MYSENWHLSYIIKHIHYIVINTYLFNNNIYMENINMILLSKFNVYIYVGIECII